ncbi:MAG: flagellar motor switch protein FliN [Halorhodospira halophila]|uniref:flagellar motor switch protein FliN n=1 Tax=Halorhodospira TaxID=85108 RepID=UPI001911697A|nr:MULTISPECIES: flagellar motor switch protein FliN [Halorhodospira]MBK5936747.1 flagellar motor switch protein FliN [Halorhodospira halophila]MBK5942809.1 flagellar motor switch protein FliN [Halorhodospira halophila]MCC3751692.1 flagellar motor switch protein FliN [Halorhodospira halophila]MCG5528822.1 flagellar motor switch protein FliN [Halorhodospira halophila]MCG5533719.1 flagellar motor switch protein FliN [Halorhodospira sp. 9621]
MSDENDRPSADDDWADALAEQKGQGEQEGEHIDDEALAEEWAAAMEEGAEATETAGSGGRESGQSGAAEKGGGGRSVDLDEFDPAATRAAGEDDQNIDVILDIPVTLSMEIGRTQISIRHLLQLNQGSVVELDRLAGEPLDVMVNGTLIAHGEVVVVNERFGIRLTDVISPAERVKKLR